jgi:hypothetical protein
MHVAQYYYIKKVLYLRFSLTLTNICFLCKLTKDITTQQRKILMPNIAQETREMRVVLLRTHFAHFFNSNGTVRTISTKEISKFSNEVAGNNAFSGVKTNGIYQWTRSYLTNELDVVVLRDIAGNQMNPETRSNAPRNHTLEKLLGDMVFSCLSASDISKVIRVVKKGLAAKWYELEMAAAKAQSIEIELEEARAQLEVWINHQCSSDIEQLREEARSTAKLNDELEEEVKEQADIILRLRARLEEQSRPDPARLKAAVINPDCFASGR